MRRVFASILASILLSCGASNQYVRAANTKSITSIESSVQTTNSRSATNVIFPIKEGSVRFAVLGDTGTGGSPQRQLAEMMVKSRKFFPFEFVVMMGDNLYGGEDPRDFAKKFEVPYKDLLAAGVKFYAALGNHDKPDQRFYRHFNMGGKEYYTFKVGNARFFALNSCYMDPKQLKWIEEELKKSNAEWKICFFHHPLYSSGKKHGPDDELRKVLEPMFVKYRVTAVFSGHEHFYERFKPQKGIYYFISGAGGKLRQGGLNKTDITDKSFDDDLHFMLVEIVGDFMYFQVISRSGKTIDQGILKNPRRGADLIAQPATTGSE